MNYFSKFMTKQKMCKLTAPDGRYSWKLMNFEFRILKRAHSFMGIPKSHKNCMQIPWWSKVITLTYHEYKGVAHYF